MIDHLTDANVGNIEYIRKQDVAEECGEWYVEEGPEEGFIGTVSQMLNMFPPADVAHVRHSRWIKTEDGAECENCGREAVYQIVDDHWEYEPWCPHCGAIMDNKRGNENDQ